jgi:penicillin G amidase
MNMPKLLMRLVLGQRLPIHDGEQQFRGLHGPVLIRRDRWGIPHLEAESLADAMFGLGYCHGQDRTFQLETLLRLGRGTLSALVGKAALPVDRLSRRIGFYRSAQEQLQIVTEEARHLLQRYVAGVNSAHEHGLHSRPHEYVLLGSTPTPWQAADVLAYLKLQSFLLPSNWDVELARLKVFMGEGADVLRDLEPGYAAWHPSTLQGLPSGTPQFLKSLEQDLAVFKQYAQVGGGSNNWIISGTRTTTGKPLLANDPHLPATVPAAWYLASIRTPEGTIAGASFAGCPAFPTAHNGHSCWGVTAGLTDNTDLFIETLSADRKSVRQADGTFLPCEVLHEVIQVKKGSDVVEKVLITPRGPIITPFLSPENVALSLCAVWLKPLPVRGFLDCFRAQDFDTFRHSFQEWPVLPLNLVYADAAGTTGWQLVGQVPQREGFNGMIPTLADLPGVGWKPDLVPFEQMPYLRNPSQGFLATANQHPSDAATPFLGHDYCNPYRSLAISAELLAKAEGWTVEDCLQLQLNVKSLHWQELRPFVLALLPEDEESRYGLDILRNWDGELASNSGAATVYELVVSDLIQRVVKQRATVEWRAALGETGSGPFSHNLFGERRHSWLIGLFRNPPSWLKKPLEVEFQECVRLVVQKLRRELGPTQEWWSWGDLRPLRVQHPLLGTHKLLGRVFNLPVIPFHGDAHTVCQSGQRVLDPVAPPSMISNLRAVFDTSDYNNSRFSLAGGQSGNPFSPNFADLFTLWQEGQGVPLVHTQFEELRSTKATLRLIPEKA